MKNLLLALVLLISGAAYGQVVDTVTVVANPVFLSVGDTDLTQVDLPGNIGNPSTIYIKCPSTNVGTIQVATYGSSMTTAPAMAAGDALFITVYSNRFWIKLSNAADDLIISW